MLITRRSRSSLDPGSMGIYKSKAATCPISVVMCILYEELCGRVVLYEGQSVRIPCFLALVPSMGVSYYGWGFEVGTLDIRYITYFGHHISLLADGNHLINGRSCSILRPKQVIQVVSRLK